MSTHVPGFQLFFMILHHFVLVKLITNSIKVKGSSVIKAFQIINKQTGGKVLVQEKKIWEGER